MGLHECCVERMVPDFPLNYSAEEKEDLPEGS
jgi:hypothetical protein